MCVAVEDNDPDFAACVLACGDTVARLDFVGCPCRWTSANKTSAIATALTINQVGFFLIFLPHWRLMFVNMRMRVFGLRLTFRRLLTHLFLLSLGRLLTQFAPGFARCFL